jgi:hypothetical protein
MTAPVLPPPPLETPMLGPDGRLTRPWALWFRQVWDYVR